MQASFPRSASTQPSQKKQPQRFDSFLLGVDTGINTSEATTWSQNFWAWGIGPRPRTGWHAQHVRRRHPDCGVFDLAQEFRGLTPVNLTTNVDGSDGDYHTFEITGTKRMSNRWSLLASYGYTKSFDNGNTTYLGNAVRNNSLPVTPNDLINTDDGRHVYSRQNAKLAGTFETPRWGLAISPMLRYQQGFPFGRIFEANLSYGSVRFLAEPFGTRRQDDIIITDLRVEKEMALGSRRNISAFLDVYNLFNSNPAQNLGWVSGTSFNRPLSIVPPRLARIGLKLNF